MSIFKYEVFNAVVECGSLTKAAESLNLTQSGVSHAIASLEAELGFCLLTRDRAGVTLTANGELILKDVREVLQCNDGLRQKVAAIKGLEIGTVRIGTFTSVSSQWLPHILKEFNKQHPTIEIKFAEGTYDDVNQWILNGSVDFGFVSLPALQSFEFMPLRKDNMLCILPKEHALAQQDEISFEEIKGEDFIMPKWGNTDDVRRILRENNINPKIKYEVVEEQTIIAMVENGLGISILPEMLLQNHTRQIHIAKLMQPAYRTIGIALHSMKKNSPGASKLIACIRHWLEGQRLLEY